MPKQADLRIYPTITEIAERKEQFEKATGKQFNTDAVVTLGDMHGNVMKFMWELVYNGVIELSQQDYQKALELYQLNWIPGDTSDAAYNFDAKKAMEEFKAILGRTKINLDCPRIRLLGDFIADRGNNDLMTLLLLEKIKANGVQVEIVASNHDLFLLPNYDEDPAKWAAFIDNPIYDAFLNGLLLLINNKIIEHKEIVRLMERVYLPSFKLISCTLSQEAGETKITLFMHAPNNCTPIKALARELGVEYPETAINAEKLADIINKINNAFQELRFSDNAEFKKIMRKAIDYSDIPAKEFKELLFAKNDAASQIEIPDNSPLTLIVFNYGGGKATGNIKELEDFPGYVKQVVHGHIGEGALGGHSENLDSDIGRPGKWRGNYVDHAFVESAFKELVIEPSRVFEFLEMELQVCCVKITKRKQILQDFHDDLTNIDKCLNIKEISSLFELLQEVELLEKQIQLNIGKQYQILESFSGLGIKNNEILNELSQREMELIRIEQGFNFTEQRSYKAELETALTARALLDNVIQELNHAKDALKEYMQNLDNILKHDHGFFEQTMRLYNVLNANSIDHSNIKKLMVGIEEYAELEQSEWLDKDHVDLAESAAKLVAETVVPIIQSIKRK